MQTINTNGDRFLTAYHNARRSLRLGPGRQSNNYECTRCGRSGSIVEEPPNEFGTTQFSVTGTITTEACS